jgi:two-component system nitrogen regulation response regulator GlnG
MARLLVVDDEPSICWALSRLGQGLGHEVVTASSAEQALELASQQPPDAVVLDVRLPGMDGLTAMQHLRRQSGELPIIIMTAYGDLNTAVEAVRQGAFEYLIKPFDLQAAERAVRRALAGGSQPGPVARAENVAGLVGRSPVMQEAFKRIALAAASDASVLLCGESGTGKELAARAIHRYSRRADGPFVAVNLASLNPSLAESELFGHARGAFTGAEREHLGLLQHADGGTLFLDEVADIPLATQVKLLRTLEHGEVLPVGAGRPVKSDFRVVSATHQELLAQIRDGRFRHDLYFRLAAFRIDLPPLRQRPDDIRELAEYFLSLAVSRGEPAPGFSADALHQMQQRLWYGNVRELRNAVEHAVIVARGGGIEPDHLPPPAPPIWPAAPAAAGPPKDRLAELIRQWAEIQLAQPGEEGQLYDDLLRAVEPPLLEAVLEKCRGQCAGAARLLGLHRTTLKKKLDQYGVLAAAESES